MKPFVFFECRPQNAVAEDEYAALLRITGFTALEIERIWLSEWQGEFDFSQYSGVIVSGSPYGYHTEQAAKSPEQIKIEANIAKIADYCLDNDFPYFGICFGLQALAVREGLPLTGEYAEDIDAVQIQQTAAGLADAIFRKIPAEFFCYTGHSEAVCAPLESGVLLAWSPSCPIQAVRFGNNVYGVQFHPEINRDSLEVRLAAYAGKYFDLDGADKVRARVHGKDVSSGEILIRAFVETYQES
ncbi:gamma-glutamyl-gamma-aminobutyrate hydrolase family protein [Arcanobacterium hippocoleae]